MITEMNSLLTAMKAHLVADTDLSYIESKSIRKYAQPGDLPDFEKWAVILSPEDESRRLIANRAMQVENSVSVVCCVRRWDQEISITGTTTGAIGIIKMVADVRASLVQFGEDHPAELLILYDEMEQPVRFNTHKFPARQDYFHEVILPYRVRMQEATF